MLWFGKFPDTLVRIEESEFYDKRWIGKGKIYSLANKKKN